MVEHSVTQRMGLGRAETVTTVVAVLVSTGCLLAFGAPYLARGVVGDSLALTVLLVPLLASGVRARHEAAVCLAGIGLVYAAGWDWPLAVRSAVWWAVFAVDLAVYLTVRSRELSGRDCQGARS